MPRVLRAPGACHIVHCIVLSMGAYQGTSEVPQMSTPPLALIVHKIIMGARELYMLIHPQM